MSTIILCVLHQSPIGFTTATVKTTVRKAVMELNYQDVASITNTNYFLPFSQKVRNDFTLSRGYVRNDQILHVYSSDKKFDQIKHANVLEDTRLSGL